jgi:glucose-6-phosphate isomerase
MTVNQLPPSQLPEWNALSAHQQAMREVHLRDLFAQDPSRATRFVLDAGPLFIDYSKHRITADTVTLLLDLARARDVEGWRTRMLAGEAINTSENRAVLHTALRGRGPAEAQAEARAALKQMQAIAQSLRTGQLRGVTGKPITDVINVGIGGSDLGPRLAVAALGARNTLPRVHFVANVDPVELDDVLAVCEAATTLVVIVSKTFGTAETLLNAHVALDWLKVSLAPSIGTSPDTSFEAHLMAVTNNHAAARAFGVAPARVLPMPDWAGGRFSLWSTVGFAILAAIGSDAFDQLLAGAAAMDAHFVEAPLAANAPVLLGLLSAWYTSFWGAQSHTVLPYSQRLDLLPDHLQQLEMESNGKRIDRDGNAINYATAPVLFGGTGGNSQHSFHQLLHQGTHLMPCDFIITRPADNERSRMLVASALAQTAALMHGDPANLAATPGNQPSTMIVLPQLDAYNFGALIALYEHKVFVEGVLWNINSFDQPGVELGKRIATQLLPGIAGGALPRDADASTRALVERLTRHLAPK